MLKFQAWSVLADPNCIDYKEEEEEVFFERWQRQLAVNIRRFYRPADACHRYHHGHGNPDQRRL